MKEIDFTLLPEVMKADAKKIKWASNQTLDDLAFMAQRKITKQAKSDMKFRSNPENAMGFKVKTTKKGNLMAEVYTSRKWMYYHTKKGIRKSKQGINYKGKSYILVPINKKAFTKTKKLRAEYARNYRIIQTKRGLLMFYRKPKNKKDFRKSPSNPFIVIGVLKQQVKHNEDIDGGKIVKQVMKQEGLATFKRRLNQKKR